MSDARDGREGGAALAFFGAITAGVSHDLNNVISTIDQVTGLLSDLVAGARAGRPVPLERLEAVQERLARQTGRGAEIIKRLNTFAHSADEPRREMDLDRQVADLMALAERYVNLRKARLEIRLPEAPLRVVSDPFRLQWALFSALECLLQAAEADDLITVALVGEAAGARVTLTGPGGPGGGDAASATTAVAGLLSTLGGSLEDAVVEGGRTLDLWIPRTMPQEGAS